jgi:hypothetical protein
MKIISIVFFLAILNNCKDMVREDDKLSISKRPYLGSNLRFDGYYYRELNGYLTVYFLYRDGTVLYASTFPANELERQEDKYRSVQWQAQVKELKHRWGLFNIDGGNILFERWYPSEPPLKVLTREGIILNDTVFNIKKLYRRVDGNVTDLEAIDEIYKFKQFSPKPDSINAFAN